MKGFSKHPPPQKNDLTPLEKTVPAHAFFLALRTTGNPVWAEDAIQDAWLRLQNEPKRDLSEEEQTIHFLRLVVLCAKDLLRSERTRTAREEGLKEMKRNIASWDHNPDRKAERRELGIAARAALTKLPEELRLPVSLCCEQGFTQAVTGEILDLPQQTVAWRVEKGLTKLRKDLEAAGFTGSAPAVLAMALGSLGLPEVPASLGKLGLTGKIALAGGAKTGGMTMTSKMLIGGVLLSVGAATGGLFYQSLGNEDAPPAMVAASGEVKPTGAESTPGGESPAVEKDAEGRIKAKDNKGREWLLEDWKEGTRPYEKDLAKREEAYRKKWGEHWDGPVFGNRIVTPGNWKWETVADVPEPIASDMWITKNDAKPHHHMRWGGMWPWPAVYAPGGGEAGDFFATATKAIVHCNLKTKKVSLIGSVKEGGYKDGMNADARMETSFLTTDIVSGRVYWVQGKDSAAVLRYVEKLLPYKSKTGGPSTVSGQGKEYLLPAFLDYKDQYKLVKGPGGEELEPVMKDGRRAEPSFAVRTTKLTNVRLPGKSPRPLITPDGKAIWLTTKQTWPRRLDVEFENAQLRDIETGNVVAALKPETPFPVLTRPTDGVGSHGGTCLGLDGRFYVCEHTGCGGGPMRLISVDPIGGKLPHLYDSVLGVHVNKRASKQWDGPADALTITATSTLIQFQCPRTGAVINGGWDNTGIRRYLDGFVTSVASGQQGPFIGRPEWKADKDKPYFGHHNCETAIAPNGDLYIADAHAEKQRIVRFSRIDWPKEQPEYGFGEQVMPKAKLEKLMLEYAKRYIANYEANSTF